jgi:hypothetical protein
VNHLTSRIWCLVVCLGCSATERDSSPPPKLSWLERASWNLDSALHTTGDCVPTSDSLRTPNHSRVQPGSYVLTLVATHGTRTRAHASGKLWLTTASSDDRSHRTGELADDTRTGAYLYGATQRDFQAVAAPVLTHDSIAPAPESDDPVYPGVLALLNASQQTVLLIGTLSNTRRGPEWVDGEGIGLWVRHLDTERFSGTWSAWGILQNGAGHFCAMAVRVSDSRR